jgi:hypothetical protein
MHGEARCDCGDDMAELVAAPLAAVEIGLLAVEE